ncbi:unnamed protein product [Acanthoscelides obtectus]|uniref:Uncharacterized protein n=1 Tax=Acanthoscelides obtectus TaxID=200917 RepID=A0A9P0PLH7_ACAOB|nr:unnamed protein product [Acanthoscelides obtectus]CAK1674451.1 hypothetical protein AOBTE_LOCUS29625 [Acanthoscelides obtectus]
MFLGKTGITVVPPRSTVRDRLPPTDNHNIHSKRKISPGTGFEPAQRTTTD